MIVPTSTGSVPSAPQPTGPKIPDAYLMMAAAQMHREGRLVQSQYGEPDTTKGDKPTEPPAQSKQPLPEEYFPSDGRRDKPAMMTQNDKSTGILGWVQKQLGFKTEQERHQEMANEVMDLLQKTKGPQSVVDLQDDFLKGAQKDLKDKGYNIGESTDILFAFAHAHGKRQAHLTEGVSPPYKEGDKPGADLLPDDYNHAWPKGPHSEAPNSDEFVNKLRENRQMSGKLTPRQRAILGPITTLLGYDI